MQKEKTKKRIGILRGGAGKYYASSIKKGGEIILHIHEKLSDKYKVVDILVDKDYVWHINGLPINTSILINKVDVVWNTSHPSFSNILDSLNIPNIGISSIYSILDNNKELLQKYIKDIGLNIPRFVIAPKTAEEVFRKFGSPWIIKNSNEIRIVKTFDELTKIINYGDDLIVEEFIAGKIASVHSVPKFRGQDIYTFPLGNLPAGKAGSRGIFRAEEKKKLEALAKSLHTITNTSHYLKSDFVLSPRGKVYLLQIDGIPNLKIGSHFEEVCESVGTKMHHVVEHILR